jgi:hypothetical protein
LTVKDVDEAPETYLWGKLKRAFPGFGDVSIRGDVDANDRDTVDLDVRANGFGTAFQVIGQAGEFERREHVYFIDANR